MMWHEIIERAGLFTDRIALLKSKSPTYPSLYTETGFGQFWVSTMVEFIYNDVKYKRHHVEYGILGNTYKKENVIDRMKHAAALCQEKAVPMWKDEVVGVVERSVARDDDSSNQS